MLMGSESVPGCEIQLAQQCEKSQQLMRCSFRCSVRVGARGRRIYLALSEIANNLKFRAP